MAQKAYNIKVLVDKSEVIILTPGQKSQAYLLRALPPSILCLVEALLVEDVEYCTELCNTLKEAP